MRAFLLCIMECHDRDVLRLLLWDESLPCLVIIEHTDFSDTTRRLVNCFYFLMLERVFLTLLENWGC